MALAEGRTHSQRKPEQCSETSSRVSVGFGDLLDDVRANYFSMNVNAESMILAIVPRGTMIRSHDGRRSAPFHVREGDLDETL